jgi:error-prone DNA polymerase
MFALGNYSAFSFQGSVWLPATLVRVARGLGYRWVGLSDRGGFFGAVRFSRSCAEEDIKPVFGCRLTVARLGDVQITIRNRQGFESCSRLISDTAGDDIPIRLFSDFCCGQADNVWISIAIESIQSKSNRLSPFHHWMNRFEQAKEAAPSNLWLELGWQRSADHLLQRRIYGHLRQQGWTRWVIQTSARYEDAKAHATALEILQSIATLSRFQQPHPDKLAAGDYQLIPAKELKARYARTPDIWESTREFVESCRFNFSYGRMFLPSPLSNRGIDPNKHLRYHCLRGIVKRYKPGNYPWGSAPERAKIIHRLELELRTIEQTGYAGYFIIFHQLVQECERRNIPLLARGSAAGSLICYALGVANVCPFRFGLSFERFLNPERLKHSKLPDIDLDLPWDRRDEMIAWLYQRFGDDHVAGIGGFSTFRGRAAVSEVARAMGIAPDQVFSWTRRLPWGALDRFLNHRSDYVKTTAMNKNPDFEKVLELARQIDGLPRHPMMHPCGMVIADRQITDFGPLQPSSKGWQMTQLDMDDVEDLGLLKLDLLGQAGLSVIRDCCETLREQGIDPFKKIDYNDDSIYAMIRSGNARGVFHIESPAMTSLLGLCRCSDLDCMVATVSVIRPGAANEDKKNAFARRYLGMEPVSYPHPALENALRDTYGLMIYEEHILFVAHDFAGMNYGAGDRLRRILIKKNDDRELASLESVFFSSARQKGRDEKAITTVWKSLVEFSGYMFNKAHGAAYAIEAFQGCWLKKHWPLPFLCAVLNNRRGFYDPLVYLLEARRLGAQVRLPSVQTPRNIFQVDNDTITFPLWAIKGLSDSFQRRWQQAIQQRPFADWKDFLKRTAIDPNDAGLLARSGALDGFFDNRHKAFWLAGQIKKKSPKVPANKPQQADCFEDLITVAPEEACPPPPNTETCAQWETELLGYPISQDPFTHWTGHLDTTGTVPLAERHRYAGSQQPIEVVGIIICVRLHRTSKGQLMKFMTLADPSGMAEAVIFPEAYRQWGGYLAGARAIRAKVTVVHDETQSSTSLQFHAVSNSTIQPT